MSRLRCCVQLPKTDSPERLKRSPDQEGKQRGKFIHREKRLLKRLKRLKLANHLRLRKEEKGGRRLRVRRRFPRPPERLRKEARRRRPRAQETASEILER